MIERLERLRDRLSASYWFVPALMATGAIALAFVTLALDERVGIGRPDGTPWPFTTGPDGARALLSTAAGSMITVSGVVFSIAIIAMTLASIQYGPRLLRNFLQDTGNQIALGTFIATFLYCLLILRAVPDGDARPVPELSVGVAVALSMFAVAVLIYFIHHASVIIQVSSIVSAAAGDLEANIRVLYPERMGIDPPRPAGRVLGEPPSADDDACPIVATGTGYVQAVDGRGLVALAGRHDLVVRLDVRPGTFVEPGMVVAHAWPAGRCDGAVARAIERSLSLGSSRTERQDIEFSIQQLVQIAVRALSPAINDPWTALACLDRLAAGLSRLARRDRPSAYRCDGSGRLRVLADVPTFAALVSQAFNEIRHAGRSSLVVTVRLLEAVALVASQSDGDEELDGLRRQADRAELSTRETLGQPWERGIIERRHREAVAVIEARRTVREGDWAGSSPGPPEASLDVRPTAVRSTDPSRPPAPG